jgi:hypothetical protein
MGVCKSNRANDSAQAPREPIQMHDTLPLQYKSANLGPRARARYRRLNLIATAQTVSHSRNYHFCDYCRRPDPALIVYKSLADCCQHGATLQIDRSGWLIDSYDTRTTDLPATGFGIKFHEGARKDLACTRVPGACGHEMPVVFRPCAKFIAQALPHGPWDHLGDNRRCILLKAVCVACSQIWGFEGPRKANSKLQDTCG